MVDWNCFKYIRKSLNLDSSGQECTPEELRRNICSSSLYHMASKSLIGTTVGLLLSFLIFKSDHIVYFYE